MFFDLGCRVRQADGIATVGMVSGVVTPQGLAGIYSSAMQQLDGDEPAVFIVDFRPAVFALTEADLNALLAGAVEPSAVAPAALVVSPTYAPMFKAHSWAMAQAGIMRKTFTCERSARQWAGLLRRVRQRRTAP